MSKNRRTHSSIDRLPRAMRDILTAMIVDNEWPADFPTLGPEGKEADRSGTPRYEDCAHYLALKGHEVSKSAIGRFGKRMRILARMKQSGVIVRDVMGDLNDEKASATQKAVAEMITAITIDFISSHDSYTAREIKEVAKAIKDCTAVSINADKYIREQLSKKVEQADKKITEIVKKKKIDPEVLKMIREQVYGIIT